MNSPWIISSLQYEKLFSMMHIFGDLSFSIQSISGTIGLLSQYSVGSLSLGLCNPWMKRHELTKSDCEVSRGDVNCIHWSQFLCNSLLYLMISLKLYGISSRTGSNRAHVLWLAKQGFCTSSKLAKIHFKLWPEHK